MALSPSEKTELTRDARVEALAASVRVAIAAGGPAEAATHTVARAEAFATFLLDGAPAAPSGPVDPLAGHADAGQPTYDDVVDSARPFHPAVGRQA